MKVATRPSKLASARPAASSAASSGVMGEVSTSERYPGRVLSFWQPCKPAAKQPSGSVAEKQVESDNHSDHEVGFQPLH